MNADTSLRPKKNTGHWRRGAGYVLYGMACSLVALWILFPGESLQRFVEGALAQRAPAVAWQVGKIRWHLPLVLSLESVVGSQGQSSDAPSIALREVRLWPDWEGLIRRQRICLNFTLSLGNGRMQGQLCRRGQDRYRVQGKIEKLRLASVPLLASLLERQVQGIFAATFEGTAGLGKGTVSDFTWKAECRLVQGALSLARPILYHTQLPFSRVGMLLAYNEDTLHITEGKIVSSLGDGWFNGSLRGVTAPLAAQVQLRGGIHPQPPFFAGLEKTAALAELQEALEHEPLSFTLSGTVQSPAIHFQSLAMQIYALDEDGFRKERE